jgi:glycine/D-amino acid oxidase-like deaminating enzyme
MSKEPLELGRGKHTRQTIYMNHSPWLDQLKRTRKEDRLDGDKEADVVVIGGGIAGLSTAYYILKHTKKSVILLEANLVAHGATGHNAGQVVSYFEKPIKEIVAEFGLEMTARAQDAIRSAWTDVEDILHETGMSAQLYACTGYLGCSTVTQFVSLLDDALWLHKAGLKSEINLVSQEVAKEWEDQLKPYTELFSVVSQKEILALLETDDKEYVAACASQKGCMNSATFTEELAGYLLKTYADRFRLFERSAVDLLELNEKTAVATSLGHNVTGKRVVLCTNGFEQITLLNRVGTEIDSHFHHELYGVIGYMGAFLDPLDRPPTAISYFSKEYKGTERGEIYYYLTRRPHDAEKRVRHNLLCIGGPEERLPDTKVYDRQAEFPEQVAKELGKFVKKTYQHSPENGPDFDYRWHGLMGYTKNGIRLIGSEPCNPVLLYNLGCNGIGILPSVYGGKKIASILAGKKQKPSIFDPKDFRCEIPPINPFSV